MTLLALALTSAVIIGIVGFVAAVIISLCEIRDRIPIFFMLLLLTVAIAALHGGTLSLFWFVTKGILA